MAIDYEQNKNRILEFFKAGSDQWDDWRWQMQNRISDFETLSRIIDFDISDSADLTKLEPAASAAQG